MLWAHRSSVTSRCLPLNPQQSPVSMLSVAQVVVESLTSYEAPSGDRAVILLLQESQMSQLSSVQLSPNRVREDFDFDTMDDTMDVSPDASAPGSLLSGC